MSAMVPVAAGADMEVQRNPWLVYPVSLQELADQMMSTGDATLGSRSKWPRGSGRAGSVPSLGLSVGPLFECGAYWPLLLPVEPMPSMEPYRPGLPTVFSPGGEAYPQFEALPLAATGIMPAAIQASTESWYQPS